jgi:two-component system, NarL family, response regulator NreC
VNRIRVFLIDDHAVLRQSLRLLIDAQQDMVVVGESERGRAIAGAIRIARADVVVLDVSMPDVSGPTAAAEIRAALPTVKIIALTRHGENGYVRQMMQAGATGYVLKQTAADLLLVAIRTGAGGGTFLDPSIVERNAEDARVHHYDATPLLTPREREVLTMVAYGHTNKEIGSALGITVKTVETHKANLMQKLEITSRAELVRFALAQGWLQG